MSKWIRKKERDPRSDIANAALAITMSVIVGGKDEGDLIQRGEEDVSPLLNLPSVMRWQSQNMTLDRPAPITAVVCPCKSNPTLRRFDQLTDKEIEEFYTWWYESEWMRMEDWKDVLVYNPKSTEHYGLWNEIIAKASELGLSLESMCDSDYVIEDGCVHAMPEVVANVRRVIDTLGYHDMRKIPKLTRDILEYMHEEWHPSFTLSTSSKYAEWEWGDDLESWFIDLADNSRLYAEVNFNMLRDVSSGIEAFRMEVEGRACVLQDLMNKLLTESYTRNVYDVDVFLRENRPLFDENALEVDYCFCHIEE